MKKIYFFHHTPAESSPKHTRFLFFVGREHAYYSHVFSVYDMTITCNFPSAKRAYFGELLSQGMKKNSIRTSAEKKEIIFAYLPNANVISYFPA